MNVFQKSWWECYYDSVAIFAGSIGALMLIGACVSRGGSTGRIDRRLVARDSDGGRFYYIEVDDHEYLLWEDNVHRGGITHSPKCKCIQKDAPHEQ